MAEPELEVDNRKKQQPPIVGVDATYEKNSAGSAFRGELNLQVKPIPVSFGVGGGVVHYNYFQPQPYVLTSVNLDTNLGLSGHLYGRLVNANLQPTSNTIVQNFEGAALGTSWSVVPDDGNKMFRVGYEVSGRYSPGDLGTGYGLLAAGASFGTRSTTTYAIGRANVAPQNPDQEYWTQLLLPYIYEAKFGTILSLKEEDIGVEVSAAPFQEVGKLSFKFKSVPLAPEISGSYRRTSEIFGGANELGIGISLELDRRIKVSVHEESGGVSIARLEMPNPKVKLVPNQLDVSLYLYGTGRIDFAQFYARLSSQEQKQVPHNYSAQSALKLAQKTMGESIYGFVDAFFSSNSFDAYSSNYANATFENKILAAARLGAIGHAYYGFQLENASAFSQTKQQVAQFNPQVVFTTMQKDLSGNKSMTDGICVNINGAVVDFLRNVGVDAYGISIGSHFFAAARDPSSNLSYVVNYGDVYKANGPGIWPAIEGYAKNNGINLIDVYVYGSNNRFMGLYHSPEGRLMDSALGMDEDLLKRSLIRRKDSN